MILESDEGSFNKSTDIFRLTSKTKIAKHTLKYYPLIFIEYFEPSCAPTTPPKSNNISKIRSTL